MYTEDFSAYDEYDDDFSVSNRKISKKGISQQRSKKDGQGEIYTTKQAHSSYLIIF